MLFSEEKIQPRELTGELENVYNVVIKWRESNSFGIQFAIKDNPTIFNLEIFIIRLHQSFIKWTGYLVIIFSS